MNFYGPVCYKWVMHFINRWKYEYGSYKSALEYNNSSYKSKKIKYNNASYIGNL